MIDGNELLFSSVGEVTDYADRLLCAHDIRQEIHYSTGAELEAINNASERRHSDMEYYHNNSKGGYYGNVYLGDEMPPKWVVGVAVIVIALFTVFMFSFL